MRDCLARRSDARICVQGSRGAGKTFALNHLAAVLADCGGVRFFDDAMPGEWLLGPSQLAATAGDREADRGEAAGNQAPIVFSARAPAQVPAHVPAHVAARFLVCRLAPWGEDDLIEYLLAAHPDQCGSVIRRLQAADDVHLLGGVPELCGIVLDQMAEHPETATVRDSIDAILRGWVREDLLASLRERCRTLLVDSGDRWSELRCWLEEVHVAERSVRILRHVPVQVMASAGILLGDLLDADPPPWSAEAVPRPLVEEVAGCAARDPAVLARLEQRFPVAPRQAMPLIATILHRVVEGWRPPPRESLCLRGAELPGAGFAHLDLRGADLSRCNLVGADLRQADLTTADLWSASLRAADLAGARLDGADLAGADLAGADLSGVRARGAGFAKAEVTGANCAGGEFRVSDWSGGDLSDSNFQAADLQDADLRGATILRADFSHAVLDRAMLQGLALREALLAGASFREARLVAVDLEFVVLPDVDFTGAILDRARLTGSVIAEGAFAGASLRSAELADIGWEYANLAGADLRGARFHAGTTRGGVHAGGQPSRWEHPPIYPDDECSRDFLPPESVRRANLYGADLRGARIDGVDFYLVDLRQARYDPEQAEVLERSGAILRDRG